MILHSQERIDVLLDDDPKFQSTGAQRSDFFQSIKESNCHVTVSNKSRQVRKVPGPKFERSAEELEFSTDDMSTVANTDRRGPNRFDLIHASSNSSSAAEEQRREGHHPGEERVKLVD
jgi:hypothetical protein